MQDRYDEATHQYTHALPIYRQIGARLGEANTMNTLGDIARRQARYGEATTSTPRPYRSTAKSAPASAKPTP
jgi:Tetratricopeptide repeat